MLHLFQQVKSCAHCCTQVQMLTFRTAFVLFALLGVGFCAQDNRRQSGGPQPPPSGPPDRIDFSEITSSCPRDWNGECGGQANGICAKKCVENLKLSLDEYVSDAAKSCRNIKNFTGEIRQDCSGRGNSRTCVTTQKVVFQTLRVEGATIVSIEYYLCHARRTLANSAFHTRR